MKSNIFFIVSSMIFVSSGTFANVVGNGHQNFNTIPSGLDFITVHSSETLKPGIINVGFYLNEAVNSLPYFEQANQQRTNFNDTLLGLDLNLGVGLTANWEVGLSAPQVLNQSIKDQNVRHGNFENRGNMEIRAMTKYRLVGDDSHGVAVVFSVNFDRTENNPYMGTDPGPIYNYELVGDTTLNRWALGLNLGYRRVNSGARISAFSLEPMGDQYIASAAASYLLSRVDTKLIVEVFGSLPASKKESNPNRTASSLEILAGIKYDYSHSLAIHAGGGTELLHGVSSPDWRAYVGLNYTFGPVFSKNPDISQASKEEKIVARNVRFDFDSDQVPLESEAILKEVLSMLASMKFSKLRVVGHTDSIGSEEYNQTLSLRRAKSIRRYLIEKGKYSDDRITAEGKGESEPIADNGNFQGRQENRRVEFIPEK